MDIDDLAQSLSPGGALALAIPDYEERPEQIKMLRAVARTLIDSELLLVEAGTGVGKSMAYLLPIIEWTEATGSRVVISTNTINLQEQLFRKDIPLLERMTEKSIHAVLLKGRSNYLCLRRLGYFKTEAAGILDEHALSELAFIVGWAEKTRDGSTGDLSFIPCSSLWEEICSDSDRCLRSRCPFNKRCFFLNSRRRAVGANILIVNHHLLMTDVKLRLGDVEGPFVIPPYDYLVVDEGHRLEEVARKHAGAMVTTFGIDRLSSSLLADRQGSPGKGLLKRLEELLSGPLGLSTTPGGRRILSAIQKIADTAVRLRSVNSVLSRKALDVDARYGDGSGRLTLDNLATETMLPELNDVTTCLEDLNRATGRLATATQQLEQAERDACVDRLSDIIRVGRLAIGAAHALESFMDFEDKSSCRWFESLRGRRRGRTNLKFCSSPFDVSELLRTGLFDRLSAGVITSATLAVGKSFSFICRGIGIVEKDERTNTLLLASPFDYDRQCMFAIPSDIPPPQDRAFTDAVAPIILEAVEICRGRTFVLFTSYRMLDRIFDEIEASLWDKGIVAMKQGAVNRDRLLSDFIDQERCVLFGTGSFWEGVDVKGSALSCVIIVKLPFQVPTDPFVAARGKWLESRGLSPFRDESLPKAVLLLKQGFGRLIRSHNDKGAVIILDKRLLSKSYGRTFLKSLPPVSLQQGAWREVSARLARYMEL